MLCPKCNYVFSEEERICPRCGEDVGSVLEELGYFPKASETEFFKVEDFFEKKEDVPEELFEAISEASVEEPQSQKTEEKREIEFPYPEEQT